MIRSIGLGEYAVGRDVQEDWAIYGLGSCVGLILCEPTTRVLAMAHVVLPVSPSPDPEQPARYGDTVVPFLLEEMKKLGAVTEHVMAQLAGGARMFEISGVAGDIGRRNVESVRSSLARHGVPVTAEEVGGASGRTLRWHAKTRLAVVSRFGAPDVILTPDRCRVGGSWTDGRVVKNSTEPR
ncbi:MAG: chemotaxis protein CheD [Clostridia bacterium]